MVYYYFLNVVLVLCNLISDYTAQRLFLYNLHAKSNLLFQIHAGYLEKKVPSSLGIFKSVQLMKNITANTCVWRFQFACYFPQVCSHGIMELGHTPSATHCNIMVIHGEAEAPRSSSSPREEWG